MRLINLNGDRLAWATVSSPSIGMILYGYDQGVMGGLITTEKFQMAIFGTTSPDPTISGLVVAIYTLGAFVSSIATMFYGNLLGRKKTLALGQILVIIGATIQATSFSIGPMIAGRIITGLGMGHVTSTSTIWAAEISRPSYRGRVGVSLLLSAVFGVIVSYWVDYACSFHNSEFSFRFPIAFQAFFSVAQIVTMLFLPESPRWLYAKGRVDEATEIIRRITNAHEDNGRRADETIAEIRDAIALEQDGKSAWRDVFTWGEVQYFRRILLAFGTQAMQQLSGINVLVYYSVVIFKQTVGMSDHLALLMGGFLSITFFAGTALSTFLIDKFGRRPLIMTGLAGACTGMVIAAVATSKSSYAAGVAATFGVFLFQFIYGAGMQAAPWIYAVEITPLKHRHIAGGVSSASGWIWTYCVVQVTEPGIAHIGYRFFIVWAVLCFVWFWVVFFFFPETKGKTLEEMDFIFMKNRNVAQDSNSVDIERRVSRSNSKEVSVQHV